MNWRVGRIDEPNLQFALNMHKKGAQAQSRQLTEGGDEGN